MQLSSRAIAADPILRRSRLLVVGSQLLQLRPTRCDEDAICVPLVRLEHKRDRLIYWT